MCGVAYANPSLHIYSSFGQFKLTALLSAHHFLHRSPPQTLQTVDHRFITRDEKIWDEKNKSNMKVNRSLTSGDDWGLTMEAHRKFSKYVDNKH